MAQELGSLCQYPSTSSIPFEEKKKKKDDQEEDSSDVNIHSMNSQDTIQEPITENI